ncbi:MAG: hypothetical protein U0793_07895 [Gemmataceae bacterium]
MKVKILALAILAICGARLDASDNKTPRQRFLALNPNYEKTAGAFYGAEYLPSAAQAMTAAIGQKAFKRADAERILEALIDGFLEKFVDAGGKMPNPAPFVEAMDTSVRMIVKDKEAFARYVRWRSNRDRKVNALAFLMTAD